MIPHASFFVPGLTDCHSAWADVAAWVVEHVPQGVVLIEGGLGAGKTTLTQVLAQKKGYMSPVLSPTYSLISVYPEIHMIHGDLYRVREPRELAGLGLEDYTDYLIVLEWGLQFKKELGLCDALINIAYDPDTQNRTVECFLLL